MQRGIRNSCVEERRNDRVNAGRAKADCGKLALKFWTNLSSSREPLNSGSSSSAYLGDDAREPGDLRDRSFVSLDVRRIGLLLLFGGLKQLEASGRQLPSLARAQIDGCGGAVARRDDRRDVLRRDLLFREAALPVREEPRQIGFAVA